MNTQEFSYLSTNKKTPIHAVAWTPDESPTAILQIAHGMAEHIERYENFAEYLTQQGLVVVGNDHLGHGASVLSKEDWGYFEKENGADCVLKDMRQLTLLTKEKYPGIPLFLLGHSMGSFFVRMYLCQYGELLEGAIICGTGQQPNIILSVGKLLTKIFAVFHGWNFRSRFVDNLAFGSMNKPFEPAATSKDWLTRDEQVVKDYLADERDGFVFTLNGYYNLFDIMTYGQNKQNLSKMPKDLPVLFISGANDPVGNMGKGVEKTAEAFRRTGMKRVKVLLYPEFRHEILNELGKEEVYEDVLAWMKDCWKK